MGVLKITERDELDYIEYLTLTGHESVDCGIDIYRVKNGDWDFSNDASIAAAQRLYVALGNDESEYKADLLDFVLTCADLREQQ